MNVNRYEIPDWLFVLLIVGALLGLMFGVNSSHQDNCRDMLAMAHSERDSLDVVVRSDVYGGSHCHIR